ncbi:DUF2946 family protein [Woodsholea maritima]|uniref:DUF2946 family protein n=1 Tax=Woodsholea maritima TaxID=240237 RepID=UPI000379B2BB|nr:DUF2946 family protein [Woodsholea maritima]
MLGLNHTRAVLTKGMMLIALIAVMIKAVMPYGYMLDAGSDGSMIVRICSGLNEDPQYLRFDPEEGSYTPIEDPESGHGSHDDDGALVHCPFALNTVVLAPSWDSFDTPISFNLVQRVDLTRAPPFTSPPRAPFAARAPPQTA